MNQEQEQANKTNEKLMVLISGVAQMAHAYQRRKNDPKMPYAVHPTMVAANALTPPGVDSTAIRCAGLLHDVVEDCDVDDIQRTHDWLVNETKTEPGNMTGNVRADLIVIVNMCCNIADHLADFSKVSFGDQVLSIVDELTVPKGAHPLGYYADGDKAARKAWERSIGRMEGMSLSALCVTYADKLYNMRNPLPGSDPSKHMAKYGESFHSILTALETQHEITLGDSVPEDVSEAIWSFTEALYLRTNFG